MVEVFRQFSRTTAVLFISVSMVLLACTDPPAQPSDDGQNNNGTSDNRDCTDKCFAGEQICMDDRTLLNCIEQSNGCLDYGGPTQCSSKEVCVSGACIEDIHACNNLCTQDDGPRCNRQGEVETCKDHNGDGCLSYDGATSCGPTASCQVATGQCELVQCNNTCEVGQTQCEGARITTCQEDAYGCRKYSAGKECPPGHTCQQGDCIPTGGCVDECEDNDGICTLNGEVRLCGVWEEGGCLTFSEPIECFSNETCQQGDCVAVQTCHSTCTPGEKTCVGNKIADCADHNSDGCFTFGTPQECASAEESCQNDGSGPACRTKPGSGYVLINEIFYDALGPDLRGSGTNVTSPTFIELFGTPGLAIEDYAVEMINGADGASYGMATLPEGASLDGNGYAVLAMVTPDSFLSLAVPHYTNVYYILESYAPGLDALQNGPDSVVLWDSSLNEVDAVGYGNFGANIQHFRGRGAPAPAATAGRSVGRIPGLANSDNNSVDFKTYYPTPGLPNTDLLINEIYANQPGQNDGTQTFVELMAPILGWEDLPLDGYVLRAIKGSDGQDYIFTPPHNAAGIDLSGINLNDGDADDGFVVICNLAAEPPLRSKCSIMYEGVPFYTGPDNFVLEYKGDKIDAVGYGTFASHHTFLGYEMAMPYSPTDAGKSIARWPITDLTRNINEKHNYMDFWLVSPTPGTSNPLTF